MNAAARELVPITQRMKNYAYNIPPSLLAQTADGRWLFWTESNDENAHVAYGLIAPNDFAAGSTDYTLSPCAAHRAPPRLFFLTILTIPG